MSSAAPTAPTDASPAASPDVTPCLWFNGIGVEAAEFYVSLVPNSEITGVQRLPDGTALVVNFTLGGRSFMALNGGPHFKFNEAISFMIPCPTQAEADRLWYALIADGGEESMCGWLKDRFGVSWQIVPDGLLEALSDPNPDRALAAQASMLEMRRLDVAAIRAAADAVSPA